KDGPHDPSSPLDQRPPVPAPPQRVALSHILLRRSGRTSKEEDKALACRVFVDQHALDAANTASAERWTWAGMPGKQRPTSNITLSRLREPVRPVRPFLRR